MARFAAFQRYLSLAIVVLLTGSVTAQTTGPNAALTWLNARQNANGTWGADPEFLPRDTARVLISQGLLKASNANVTAGLAWLANQRGFDANQFLAEQSVALWVAKLDATASLDKLSQQRSNAGPDYGGFIDHTGDSYDSALALQALATQEAKYVTAVAGVVTTLITRQNPDGGWGIDTGFDSNPVITAEVLTALSSTAAQQAPPATVAAAQAYLASRRNANGSIGVGPLETATAFRALALSGYPLSATATATLNYLTSQQSADGSWGGDFYVTARVLEAYAANKPNLTIKTGEFTLSPTTVTDGATVTATVKVTNIGSASASTVLVRVYVGDVKGRQLATNTSAALAAGATRTVTLTFAATSLTGTQNIAAVVDPLAAVDEMREDDNSSTTTLAVAGKPDLQIFSADIVTAPARLQPAQEGAINITIRNTGEGEATNVGYAVYRTTGGTETLLKKASVDSIAAESAAVVSIPVTLAAGSHTIRAVADPDLLITETSETNNTASKSVSVTAAANVDLRIRAGEVWTDPQRPTAGQSFGIVATVENSGLEAVTSKVAFYDGVPGAGGVVIAVLPIQIAAQGSQQVQVTHTATADSRVVYAVADPDDLIPEIDEANNGSHALLTDQYADLVLTRDGFVIPRATFQHGASMTTRLVVRNNGVLPATGVHVLVYDDVPQNGGIKVLDTTIDVPALGKTVVNATWNVRAGQRFATAMVNDTNAIFEPNYANNKVTKLYTPNGPEGDIGLSGTRANGAIDATQLIVDQATLTVSGNVAVNITTPVARPFTVTLFEDVDGDHAFHAEIDAAVGSTLVPAGQNPQRVVVNGQGTVRFAPGKLVLHLDSSNAINENNEKNNFLDIWRACEVATTNPLPGIKWRNNQAAVNLTPVARFKDTNGDDIIDDNDVPYIVTPSRGTIELRRGDTGERLWTRGFGFFNRQLSPAVGDLDGDGVAEILATTFSNKIVALDVNGVTKWTSPELPQHPDWDQVGFFVDFTYVGAPVIADLEGDGAVEVIVGKSVLNGANGTIKWIGGASAGRAFNHRDYDLYFERFPDQEAPIVADLTGDGKLEVIAGSTAYKPDGTILWHRGDLGDGYAGAVYLGAETTPSIALVANGRITMLRSDGTTRWGPTVLPGGTRMGGAPTMFVDANVQYVGVAGDGWYTVYNATTGVVKWSKQTTTNFSHGIITTNAATAYDFGSGMTLAYAARHNFYLLRASDGAILYDLPNNQALYYPTAPVVADVDGDGRTDISVPGADGTKIISDARWNGTRSVFNQLSYNVANVVNDRAQIPAVVTQTPFSKTHFRTNVTQPSTAPITGQPNLTASYMRADTSAFPASAKLTVRAGNNGWFKAIDTTVTFYRVVGTTATVAGTATLRELPPGDYEDVTFVYNNPPADTTAFYAVVDEPAEVTECVETDNKSLSVSVRLTTDILVNPATGLLISDPQPRRGETIELVANAELSSAVNGANVRAQFFLGDPAAGGTPISSALPVAVTTEGDKRIANVTTAWNVTAPVGPQTMYVVFDPANAIAEADETNNKAAVAITVGASVGHPDLQVFAADINTSPSRLQPGQQATITVTIRNGGKGDASNIEWALYDVLGSTQTLLTRGTIASLPLGAGQIVSATATLAGGTHSIRAVLDPDNAIAESNETNNDASRSIDVSPASNVDFRVAGVTATPNRPTTGQSITISATVENGGSEAGESKLGFYDGVPGHGGNLIALVPLNIDAQSSVTVQQTYAVLAGSIVVYAVADPDDVLPEIDESNNAASAVLTDNYSDLAVTRDDITLSSTNVAAGATVNADVTIHNRGLLAATAVPVIVYDDAPASGGRIVLETTVDVGAQGLVTLPVSWAARAGQRFATVVVNGSNAVVETDFSNNRATRFYTGSGDEADLSLDATVPRGEAIDTSAVAVDANALAITGFVKLRLNTPGTKTFTVTVFEDADGDLAYDSEVDNALGSALVDAGVTPQTIDVGVTGNLRFTPGKLAVYIDSTNAVSETDESNNLLEFWQDCRNASGQARPNLTASYMRVDGSGYPTSAKLIARIGNNGILESAGTGVAFYAIRNGSPTLLGRAGVVRLQPGQYQDVIFTVPNPPADITSVYAVADDTGTSQSLSECNENDNRTPNVGVQFSADVAVLQAMFAVTDPQPRQGDTIDFGAVARISGAVNASQLKAQFYLGDPAVDGQPISTLLPVTISVRNNETTATLSYRWTVTATPGTQAVYVVFDPAGVIAEDAEDNNKALLTLNVSTPDPVRKLSGGISFNPPTAEPGLPVKIEILVKNIGNVPLTNVILDYTVTGGTGVNLTGGSTLASLAKNSFASITLGQFTANESAQYTVAVTPRDPAVTLIGSAKLISIAPFAAGSIDVAPNKVPVAIPMIQAHTRVTRTNTILLPDDPLVPLIKTHLQKGVNWIQTAVEPQATGCYKCHVQAQALAGMEASRDVSGITVSNTVSTKVYDNIIATQNANGSWHDCCQTSSTTSGAWALAHHSDPVAATPALVKALDFLLPRQSSDGGYNCDNCDISFAGRETPSMFAMVGYSRGHELTHDPDYQTQLQEMTQYALAYNYLGTRTTGPEYAARIAIGLAHMIPQLQDAGLKNAAEDRLQAIARFLRELQNADGTFGTLSSPDVPVIRTAQALYALALAGTPGNDPGLRASILWLLNAQRPEGGWSERRSEFTQPIHWYDETTWAVIALPAAFLRLGQFDVDLQVTMPNTSQLVSATPPANRSELVDGGRRYIWQLTDVSESGYDVYMDIELTGIQNDEIRAATGAASLVYKNPYSQVPVTRTLTVPSVIGVAPILLDVTTDQPSYPAETNVAISEIIQNVGTTREGITNDVIIQDANGLTVATVVANDPVTGLPPTVFPGWNYAVPVSVVVENAGTRRIVAFEVDWTELLADAGATTAFEPKSIRVTADANPASELFHLFVPDEGNPQKGDLIIQIPDDAPVGTNLAMHVYFDELANGFKPTSMFNLDVPGSTGTVAGGGGFRASYWRLNTSLSNGSAPQPANLVYQQPAILNTTHTSTTLSSRPAGVPSEFWATEWTGAVFAPVAGTYNFLLGSDDGSWLYIDDVQLINNGGNHGTREITGSRVLTAGFHTFKVVMFNWGGPWSLYLRWALPGQSYQSIPSANLFPSAPAADPSDIVIGAPERLVIGGVQRGYNWNTGSTAAGEYLAVASLKQFGTLAVTESARFLITPSLNLAATIGTDKPAYDAGETVRITGAADYSKGNVTLTNASATVSVIDASNATIASGTTPIASLIPGQTRPATLNWPAGSTPAGTYTAKIVIHDSAGVLLAMASVPFEIRSTSNTGKGVTGTIAGPAEQYASEPVPFSIAITNGGNADLVDAPFAVIVLDPATETPAATFDFTASIAAGATHPTEVTWLTTLTTPQKTYDVFLVSRISGTPVPIATTKVKIIEPPFSNMTGTIATDRAAYDCNEEVSITSTVNYVDGNITRRNMTATLTVTAPSGSVIATQSTSAATLAVGASMNVNLVWPTAASAPGIYTIRLVAANDILTFVDTTATFEVRSSAVTGKCITGTIASLEWVYAGSAVPFEVSLTNDGNASLTDAPFAVVVTDPATQDVIATLDFTASVAKGASHSTTVTWSTTAETKYQVYAARLVSKIAAASTLAQSTVEVKEPPYSNMSATVATDAAAYDCSGDVSVTAGVVYDKGNVTRSDVTATITIADPSGATVATISKTAATFAVGDTISATLDWATASSAPGTYAVTVTVADAEETYATASSSFEIRSSAVTGLCISGTIAAPESVTVGDPVPFDVSILNGGNAALAAAPFAIVISHPTTDAHVATLTVVVDAATGATFTSEVPWATASVLPQFYTARLVSLITGSAVTLAETTVEVKVPPLKLELSLGAPPRVLIWADCANGNGASNCTPTAPAFITKTLNDAGIPWTLVGDQYSFINALRSGAYDEAILYQRSAYEDKVFAEYLETIRGGTGLLLIKAHSDAMPKLAPALGVTFKGNLNATSTVLELLDTPFTTAGQLSLNGDGVKIELAGAQAAAKVLSTQAPAISYNTFGAGRVVIVPFDLEKTTTEGSAKLILGAVRYVARTHTFDARRVVAIDFKVTPPPGAPSNLTIAAELPEGMTVVHAMPALTTAEPPSWNVTSDGTELHLYLWVRLPDDGGTYTVTGTGAFTGQLAIVTKTMEVEVTADRVALETTLQSALTALVTAAPAKDQKHVTDAQTQLNAIKAANPTDNVGVVAVINRVLSLIGNLQAVSVDTAAARNAADRMLAWWQSRASA